MYQALGPTMLSVPTMTDGGTMFADTISEMKFAVMPMMAIMDAA